MEEKKSKKPLIIVSIIVLLMIAVAAYFIITKVINKKLTPPTTVETEEQKEKITPLMYEITKEGSTNKIYLIGSIHFANISKIEFPKYVMNAYNNSPYLACEFNILKFLREVDQTELVKDYYYTYPDSLDKHVSKETYDKIVKYLQDNNHLNEDAIKVLSLSYIDSLLSQTIYAKSDIGNSEGVDTYFLQKAEKDGKTILEVESYEFQTSIEKSFPDRITEISVNDILDDMDGAVNEVNELYKYWKEGNVDKLVELFVDIDETEYSKEDLVLMEQYNKKMLDDRNIGMKDKLEEYFNNDYTVFYMVGTAHLIGDKGIAKLLENDGYTVTLVK